MEDTIIQKIIQLETDVAEIKEKMKKVDMIDDLISGQDQMLSILQRLDHERTFGNERIVRLEKDIEKIKKHLELV